MKTGPDHRITPSDLSPDVLSQLEEMVQDRSRALLVGSNGERIELPEALNDLLTYVVEAMRRKQTLFLMPEDASLTTQAAARFLGMSRPYLLRLLDAGEIPYHRVGTHRRIQLGDLRAYRERRDREGRSRLDALSEAVEDAGVYDRV